MATVIERLSPYSAVHWIQFRGASSMLPLYWVMLPPVDLQDSQRQGSRNKEADGLQQSNSPHVTALASQHWRYCICTGCAVFANTASLYLTLLQHHMQHTVTWCAKHTADISDKQRARLQPPTMPALL